MLTKELKPEKRELNFVKSYYLKKHEHELKEKKGDILVQIKSQLLVGNGQQLFFP